MADVSVTVASIRHVERDSKYENWIQDESTVRLAKRVAVDAVTALSAALTVSPIMTAIDRAVIEAAAGQKSVMMSMKASLAAMARHPVQLLHHPPFKIMMLLYSGTYLTANALDTASSHRHDRPASSTTSTWSKLGTVCAVNGGLSLYKDSQFARIFGTVPARHFPAASYVPLVLRDGLTLFATFNLPQLVAPSLPIEVDSVISRLALAQLTLPAAMQVFATPLHLLGLDLYNRVGKIPWQDRVRRVRINCRPATLARMCRVIPAFGLGGAVNTSMRSRLMNSLE